MLANIFLSAVLSLLGSLITALFADWLRRRK